MTSTTNPNGTITVQLTPGDVNAAIEQYVKGVVCQLASGYSVEVSWPVGMEEGPMPIAIGKVAKAPSM